MKKLTHALFLFFAFQVNAQKSNVTYHNLELAMPFKGNPERTSTDPNANKSFLLPDGLSSKIGYGLHYKKSISVGLHTGIDWKISAKVVSAPVFANLKFSPRLTENDESRLFVNLGYGRAFALGRGDLSGKYLRGSLGLEAKDDEKQSLLLFIDISRTDLVLPFYPEGIGSISLGIAVNFF